jgi:uncharacterized protein (DUF1800 family)
LHESLWSFFTLGKDPLSQYTEVDVIQAAKVLTGWRVVNLNTATPALILISIFMIRAISSFPRFFNNTVTMLVLQS